MAVNQIQQQHPDHSPVVAAFIGQFKQQFMEVHRTKSRHIMSVFSAQLAGKTFLMAERKMAIVKCSVAECCAVFLGCQVRFHTKLSHQIEMKKCYVSVLSGIVNLL